MISIAVLALVHFRGGQLGMIGSMIEHFYPSLISTNSWIRALESEPTSEGYSVYGYLERRKTDAAVEHALNHIHSEDAYLWLNAATYLGSRNRTEAIPYLIKSIRHTAWRSVSDRTANLSHITGQTFGTNFDDWRLWYETTYPEHQIDWDSSLGHDLKL